jgi:hypothetical protein
MTGTYLANLLFLLAAAAGSVYLVIEIVLQTLGKSICISEGCAVVANSTRFGDLSMTILGLGIMTMLVALAGRNMRTSSVLRDRLIDTLLVAALAGEGFLVGYQFFRLHATCAFCLSVAGIYVLLGILRLLGGHREVIAGFAAFGIVLLFYFLVLPVGGTALPLNGKYVLFFSPDCSHCAEIRKEIEEQKLDILHVQVDQYAQTLKNLGIEHVPTLMINGPYEKVFLTGTDAIRAYLVSCQTPVAPAERQTARTEKRQSSTLSSVPPPPQGGALQPFLFPGQSGQIFNPPPDEGLCRENTKCN